jgi:hypothetical protein
MSELRNGPKDNQENLQWAFLLLNTAFFACIRTKYAEDENLIDSLGLSLGDDGKGPGEMASKVHAYLATECG